MLIAKNCGDIPKVRKITVVLFKMTLIHTFGAVIEQLSLTIEIMVKCSHAGLSNKSVNIF